MYFDKKILLSVDPDGTPVDNENIIIVEDVKYFVRPLDSNFITSKGGNSSVYKLVAKDKEELAIKFSNYSRPTAKGKSQGYSRFLNEISGLKEANEMGFPNVIKYITDDVISIDDRDFPYIIMEKADTDLKEYLLKTTEIDIPEKFLLCKEIFKAIKDLHSIHIYHRDIKPDNILLFITEDKFSWKIADLGLIKYRENDFDYIGEKIGPLGWFSPEATNKFITERYNLGHDCTIDEYSDIFMLGELFWFVFRLNIPVGQIQNNDFNIEFPDSDKYYTLMRSMLSHSKQNRLSLDIVGEQLDVIGKNLLI